MTTRARRGADPAGAPLVADARHDRRLRDGGRRPGAAELRRRRRLPLDRLRVARVRLDARDLDADLRARPGRLRAARLPDQQAPAARGDHGVPARAAAEHPVDERLHGVQAPRHRLRDGRARHAVPRPRHACRLRRALPLVQPRLLRLLRPDGDAEHRLADAAAARARAWATAAVERVFRTFNVDGSSRRRGRAMAERAHEDDQDRLPRPRRGRGRDARRDRRTAGSTR